MITFPLYDLDISEYVSFHKPGMCYEYDLFGIVVSNNMARFMILFTSIEPLWYIDWWTLHQRDQERKDRRLEYV